MPGTPNVKSPLLLTVTVQYVSNALDELNNYLTGCPLRAQGESSRSISKNAVPS